MVTLEHHQETQVIVLLQLFTFLSFTHLLFGHEVKFLHVKRASDVPCPPWIAVL